MTDGVLIRRLTPADVPAAHETAYQALREAGQRYRWHTPPLDEALRRRGQRRIRHCLDHDPAGAHVAEQAGRLVGVGLATRRGPLWFLSLLAVSTERQGTGIGRRLLEATTATLEDAGAICSSDDPKALRRYRRAGFDLLPCLEATGTVDRSRLPADPGVRQGSFEADRDLVEQVAGHLRGAPHGPDLDFYAASGQPLFVLDEPGGRGYMVLRATGPSVLGATTAPAAARLLWAALAAATAPEPEVRWLTHDQQWAIDVALAAGLSIRPSGATCRFGRLGPMAPYLPSGAFG